MRNRDNRSTSLWADFVAFLLAQRELLGRWGHWMALAGFLVLAWLADASSLVVQHLADPLWNSVGWRPDGELARAVAALFAPALLFALAAVAIRALLRRQRREPPAFSPEPIAAHRGLVASLSLFRLAPGAAGDPGQMRQSIRAAAVEAAGSGANSRDRLLQALYATTWGPLAAAVELHSERLTHVWLLCSRAVESDLELVQTWIRRLTAGRAVVASIPIADHNSVQEVRLRIQAFYEKELRWAGLAEDEAIADITSGSAAMSAGIVLATLDEQRHVQYLAQGPATLLLNGVPRRDLREVFQYVATSPADVARAFASYLESRAGSGARAAAPLNARP